MQRSIPVIISILLLACTNKKNKESTTEVAVTNCYEYKNGGDTIFLELDPISDSITGSLVYSIQGKDRNTGTIRGVMKNDILLADYFFMSEGTQSARQVAFKKTTDGYVEGFGEVIVDTAGAKFKYPERLDFNQSIQLKRSICE